MLIDSIEQVQTITTELQGGVTYFTKADIFNHSILDYDAIRLTVLVNVPGKGGAYHQVRIDKRDFVDGKVTPALVDNTFFFRVEIIGRKGTFFLGFTGSTFSSFTIEYIKTYTLDTLKSLFTTETAILTTTEQDTMLLVLEEMKKQTVNLEVQGRFIAQSTRAWNTNAYLTGDEYNQAKLQVLEEYTT